jgi:hypothetical protein
MVSCLYPDARHLWKHNKGIGRRRAHPDVRDDSGASRSRSRLIVDVAGFGDPVVKSLHHADLAPW